MYGMGRRSHPEITLPSIARFTSGPAVRKQTGGSGALAGKTLSSSHLGVYGQWPINLKAIKRPKQYISIDSAAPNTHEH